MDLCLSQEISQVWARLEVTHQLKNQFLIVQIGATARQIAVHLNILLLKRTVIWIVTVNQLQMSTKTMLFAAKVINLDSLLIISFSIFIFLRFDLHCIALHVYISPKSWTNFRWHYLQETDIKLHSFKCNSTRNLESYKLQQRLLDHRWSE